jgi:hypothetical protein
LNSKIKPIGYLRMGIIFEKYTDDAGYFPLDNEEVAEEITPAERYAIEMLFDK